MQRRLFCTLGLMAAGWVGFTANPASAATAAGPYYANPSWDQQLPASTRFVVLSNWIDAAHPSGGAAVLDRETGLVWERSPSTTPLPWGGPGVPFFSSAQYHCNDLNAGGRTGWRLPTIQELLSLVDRSVPFPGPALPNGHPFSNVQSIYWSATTEATFATLAWAVSFSAGNVGNEIKSGTFFAWCVRGGQGVDPQ
jgi:hypothetical protein